MGEGGTRCSRRVRIAPLKGWDWASADETEWSPPSERFPGTNPPFPPFLPLLLPSSPPGPPCCHRWSQHAGGGCCCFASSGTDPESAWALSSAEVFPPSRRFYPDKKESPLCNHRSDHSPAPRTPNHRPVPEKNGSSPGSAQLSCCGNISGDQPI